MPWTLTALLEKLVEQEGSSLHLTAESPPLFRVDGALRRVDDLPLSPEEVAALATSVLAEKQKEHLYRDLQVEFSFGLQNVARFRAAILLPARRVRGQLHENPVQPGPARPARPGSRRRDAGRTDERTGPDCRRTGLRTNDDPRLAGRPDSTRTRAVHILTVEQPIEYVLSHQLGR